MKIRLFIKSFIQLIKPLIVPLIIPLLFFTIVFLILAYFFPWRGLWINLAVTFVGIIITVCYVNFILQELEKRRWLPVKQTACAQLLDVTTRVILSVTPRQLFDISSLDMNLYKFGTNYRTILLAENQLSEILCKAHLSIEDGFRGKKRLSSRIVDILQDCEKKLTGIVDQIGFILEPEVVEAALSFRNSIQEIYPSPVESLVAPSSFRPKLAAISLYQILATAIALRLALAKQKDKIVPSKELSADIKETFKTIYRHNNNPPGTGSASRASACAASRQSTDKLVSR